VEGQQRFNQRPGALLRSDGTVRARGWEAKSGFAVGMQNGMSWVKWTVDTLTLALQVKAARRTRVLCIISMGECHL
jgi:hypothetical protein